MPESKIGRGHHRRDRASLAAMSRPDKVEHKTMSKDQEFVMAARLAVAEAECWATTAEAAGRF